MNKIAVKLMIIGLLGASIPVFAQRGPGPGLGRGPSAEERVQRMTVELGLSAEQQASLLALLQGDKSQREKCGDGHAAVDAGVRSILTHDQFVEFEAGRQNHENRPPPPCRDDKPSRESR